MTKADEILSAALGNLSLKRESSPYDKFAAIYPLIEELRKINEKSTISVGTTGTITDRICEWALQIVGEDIFYRLTKKEVKWLGDYGLLGYPLNIIVSVKSFKAKERLLMSGTGSQLVPTIGFGLFDDSSEFSVARLTSYRLRGFLAIYMPQSTLDQLPIHSQEFLNWNSTVLLRPCQQLPLDLERSIITIKDGPITRRFVDPIKL